MRRALGFAFVAEALTTLCQVVGFKLAFALWGAAGFGEWMLARRLLSFVMPLATLGLEIAVPRYVALARAGESSFSAAAITSAAIRLGLASAAALYLLMGISREVVALAAFGDAARASLVLPTAGLVVAYALHVLVYAYLRGSSRAAGAGVIHVGAHGLIPLIVFALRPESPARALALVAWATIACAISVATYVLRRDALDLRTAPPAATRALVRYGRSRMAAAVGLLLLATLPAAYSAHAAGVERAGVVALGLSLIGIAGTAATPIGVALLPAAAVHFARRGSSLLPPLSKVRALAAGMSALGAIFAYVVAPFVASALFATTDDQAALTLRLCGIAAGPYFFFCCMRTLVDAQTARAVNARVVGFALLVFFAVAAASRLLLGMDPVLVAVGSYVAACFALAAGIWRALEPSRAEPEAMRGGNDLSREAPIA